MKIWIHIDGEPKGPYDIESLPLERIDGDTPVWHNGLADWVAAKDSPVVRPMLGVDTVDSHVAVDTPVDTQTEETPQPEAPQPVSEPCPQPQAVAAPRPAVQKTVCEPAPAQATAAAAGGDAAHSGPATTYLLPTLIISVATLNLVGIVPLIMGLGVRRRNRRQAYASAWSLSVCTAWWVMITIVVSLMIPFSMLI